MCRLLETIRVREGRFENLHLHAARVRTARKELFGLEDDIGLNDLTLPQGLGEGTYKCRVIYRETIEQVEFVPYIIKKLSRIGLVVDDDIDYRYKYADRRRFKELKDLHADCDEIIIVKNGLLTDTTYSNIALFDGKAWFTPATPLLNGIRRQLLLQHGRISEARITPKDLKHFSRLSLINALLDLGEVEVNANQIL
jgi:4-amino-4-deoxychorismate lyase